MPRRTPPGVGSSVMVKGELPVMALAAPSRRRFAALRSVGGRLALGLGVSLSALLAVAGGSVRENVRAVSTLQRQLDASVEQRTRLALSSDATMRFVALAEAELLAPAAREGSDGRAERLAATADSLRRALLAEPGLSVADRNVVERMGLRQATVEVRLSVARAFRDVGRADDAATEATAAAQELDSLVADAKQVTESQERASATARATAVSRAQAQRRQFGGVILIALVVAVGLAWVTVQSITGPLRALVAHARALSQGDFALRTDARPLPGEFAALGAAMNHASAALDAVQAQLTHQAEHDSLTGLANRARFRERVRRALTDARAAGAPWRVALIAVDLDGFKAVNDCHGHAAGDQVLVETASRLLNATRGSDTVARLGGDEFAVLLENVRHPDDLRLVAQRIVEVLGGAVPLDVGAAVWAAVGASVGVTIADADLPLDTEAAYREMARRADAALYAAKAGGKRQYVFHTEAAAGASDAAGTCPGADAAASAPTLALDEAPTSGPATPRALAA